MPSARRTLDAEAAPGVEAAPRVNCDARLAALREAADRLAFAPLDPLAYDIFQGLFADPVLRATPGVVSRHGAMAAMLRWLHEPSVEASLDAARWFRQREQNPFLAYLAELGALRLDPTRADLYERCASFARRYRPPALAASELSPEACRVSVILPTTGSGPWIDAAIASVLAQTERDFELVIVNDGGPDRCRERALAAGDARVRYQRIPHTGLAGALNAGLRAARGRYVAYLDDDDVYLPEHLSRLLEVASRGARFVYSKSRVLHGYRDAEGRFLSARDAGTRTRRYSPRGLATRLGINVLNVLHERALCAEVGLFEAALPWSMDWEYWVRIAQRAQPVFVDAWSGEYRRSLDNMTSRARHVSTFFARCLLVPYFTTAHGALTLYSAARGAAPAEADEWLAALASRFVHRSAMRRAIARNPRLARDLRLWRALLRSPSNSDEFRPVALARAALGTGLRRIGERLASSAAG
jgi:glycosyltransferase involved in cell wall biosynthesis